MSLPVPASSDGSRTPATVGVDDSSLGSPLGRAAGLMVAFLAVLWVVELINAATDRGLVQSGGIRPRDFGSLIDILTAPFLHGNLSHLAYNALPLFSLGMIAALTGLKRFLAMTAVVIVVGGLGTWLISPQDSVHVGASGVVFGYFGYLLMRGLVDRRPVDLVISVGIALSFGYAMWNSIGFGEERVSWQGHVSGLVGGMLAAWIFRLPRAKKPKAEDAVPEFPSP